MNIRAIRQTMILLFALFMSADAQVSKFSFKELQLGYAYLSLGGINKTIQDLNKSGWKRDEIHHAICFQGIFYHPYSANMNIVYGAGIYIASSNQTIKTTHTIVSGDEIEPLDLMHKLLCIDLHMKGGFNFPFKCFGQNLGLTGVMTVHMISLNESGKMNKLCNSRINCPVYEYENFCNGWGIGSEFSVNAIFPLGYSIDISADTGIRLNYSDFFKSDWVGNDFTLNFSGPFIRIGFRF